MKIPALVTVVALTCGAAVAAQSTGTSADSRKRPAVTAQNQAQAKGEGLGAKTKRAFQRMGDKMRSAGQKVGKATGTDKAARDDTRSMGAAGADQQDAARRNRMDEAYSNWKSRQK